MTRQRYGAGRRNSLGAISPTDDPELRIIRELVLAEPPPLGRAFFLVAQGLGLSPRMVRKFWEGDSGSVGATVRRQIRDGHTSALRARLRREQAKWVVTAARLDQLVGSRGDAKRACEVAVSYRGGMDRRRPLGIGDGRAVSHPRGVVSCDGGKIS